MGLGPTGGGGGGEIQDMTTDVHIIKYYQYGMNALPAACKGNKINKPASRGGPRIPPPADILFKVAVPMEDIIHYPYWSTMTVKCNDSRDGFLFRKTMLI